MKPVAFVLFIAIAALSHAQQSYTNLYESHGASFIWNMTELDGGNVLIGLGPARGISRLDAFGNVIQTQSHWSDTLTGIGGIRHYAANEFVFAAGYRKDTCYVGQSLSLDRYPTIGKVDSLGTLLELRQYSLAAGCSNAAGDIVVTADGGIVAWGYRDDFFALKVDSDLIPIWAKAFDYIGGIQFIKELPGGDLLAGINMATAGAVVARISANGDILWCKSYIRPRGMIHDAVIESDDSYVITGYTDSILNPDIFDPLPDNYHPKLFMMKLDGAGEVDWCRGYEGFPSKWYTAQWSQLTRTNDGQLAVLATIGDENYNVEYQPFLMKTDLNGDTLWTRSFGRDEPFRYYSRGFLAHSDGGFLFNGQVFGDLPMGNLGMAYVFKTDSMGHLPCFDRPYPVVISELFPTDSSFNLISVDGAVAGPAFLSDTTFAAFSMYDACDVITNVSLRSSSHHRPRVRPNPNTGQFTVEFADPLIAESYYSVYDTMGKLLFQRRLPTGATQEEVDLTGFSPGTYVLRFTDRDGVCYERVVLE